MGLHGHSLASLKITVAVRRLRSIVSKSATVRGGVTRLIRCVTSRRLRVSRRTKISLTRLVRDGQEHFVLISIATFLRESAIRRTDGAKVRCLSQTCM